MFRISARSLLLVCLAGSLALFLSCAKQGGAPGGGAKKEGKGTVLARVDGEVISLEEFDADLAGLPEYTRNQLKSKEQKIKRLDRMIEDILLRKEAERRGLDQDEEIRRKVDRYRDRLVTEELYKRVAQEKSSVSDAEINQYYEEHKDQDFVLLGIDAGDPVDEVTKFVDDYNLPFPILLDPNNRSLIAFKNDGLPSSYVINRDGNVVLAWTGPINRAMLEKYVTPLLEQ